METFETSGSTWIGARKASGPFVKLRASADDLSITTPIVSIAFGPREVVAFRRLRGLFGYGGFEIVHTYDRRKVQFWCRDADAVLARIAATGFVPRGTAGGGPDPTRAAARIGADRADHRFMRVVWAVVAGLLVAVAGLLWWVSDFTHEEVYQRSWAMVRSDPRVVAVTGSPVGSGKPSGSVSVSGPDGQATLHYEVSGPRGRGTVDADGVKASGRWRLDRLVFRPAASDATTIDLSPSR